MRAASLTIKWLDADDNERETQMPALWAICSHCRGEGKTSVHLGSFTQDEWEHEDDEFKEDYLNGFYDQPCEHCKGSGKLLEIDTDVTLSPEQREALAWRQRDEEEAATDRRTQINEMLMEGSITLADLH